MASVNVGGFTSTSASFTIPISSSIGFRGNLTGTASWATVAVSASIADNTGTNLSYYPVFVTAAGNQGLQIDTVTLSYNPSTNILTTTASSAATASNISTAFVGSVAPNNQILISKGTGQVTGSSLLSFDPAVDGGQITIGAVTIDQNTFTSNNANTFNFTFGGATNAISITNPTSNTAATAVFNVTASFLGGASFTNTQVLTVSDNFILLNSGSHTSANALDSGIIFEDNQIGVGVGTGSALYHDYQTKRLAYSLTASYDNNGLNPDAFINMTFVGTAGQTTSVVDNKFAGAPYGSFEDKGLIFIADDGNIYIKS